MPTSRSAAARLDPSTLRDDEDVPLACPEAVEDAPSGLSNDYLNHFSEVLMLIEMAPDDPDVVGDLAAWRPLDYRAYFEASPLRRAPAALAAYDALPEACRQAFESLTGTMTKLARVSVAALRPPCEPEEAALVADVTAQALRPLIDRAASFLNSGGRDVARGDAVEEAQVAIDRLMERVAAE